MAPNTKETNEALVDYEQTVLMAPQAAPRKYHLYYFNILYFTYWHLAGLYGLYLCFTSAKWTTLFFNVIIYVMSMLGIGAGTHRLWAHRAYKAKMPLQILLMLLQTMAFQSTILHWVRDHRLHHKYCDTDADPHNATRGFFYSHIGWLLAKKHPEVTKRGNTLDVADIYENPVLQFQKKYYLLLAGVMAFAIPVLTPISFWHENLNTAYHVSVLRHITVLNATFLVNSAAHKFGYKPYDKYITPIQSATISLTTMGEGFHNYHHVFPFDYRTAELGNNYLNVSTKCIDFFAWIGWAYDLKQASADMIDKKKTRTGDGTDLWGRVKD